MPEVRVTVKNIVEGSQQIQQSAQGLTNVEGAAKGLNTTLGVIKNSLAAVTGAAVTLQQAFEFSKQGAELNQLTESFGLMNQEVFKTPDLLNQMSAAVNGTIKETDLMRGLLTLTAGTSREMSQAMAEAAPQLLEIAKASNKLNPALGDTAFLYESISRGIKRGSPLILDNLGIVVKIEEANQKWAAANGVLVSSMTAEEKTMALLNAVMESGDTLIAQVGGNVDSQADAWARLEVQLSTTLDKYKILLAEGLSPWMEAASGQNAQVVQEMITGNLETAKSIDALITEAQKLDEARNIWGGLGAAVTGTEDEIQAGIEETVRLMATQAGSFEEFATAVESGFGSRSQAYIDAWLQKMGVSREEFFAFANAADLSMDRGREAIAQFLAATAPALRESAEEIRAWHQAMAEAAGPSVDLADKQAQLGNHISRNEGIIAAANAANKAYFNELRIGAERTQLTAEALTRQAAAAREATAAQGQLFTNISNTAVADRLLSGQLGTTNTVLTRTGGLTATQADELDRLQGIYDRAARKISDFQSGLTASNVNVEEQTLIMQNAQAAMAPLLAMTEQLSSHAVSASVNESALNSILSETANTLGFSAEARAAVAVATGEMTKETANAILQEIAIRQEAEALMIQFQKGYITMDEVSARLGKFAEGLATAGGEAGTAAGRMDALREAIERIPTEKRVTIRGEVDIPPLPDWLGGGGEGGNGKPPPKGDKVATASFALAPIGNGRMPPPGKGSTDMNGIVINFLPNSIVISDGTKRDTAAKLANEVSRRIAQDLRGQLAARR